MRPCVPSLLVAVAAACSKPSASAAQDDPQDAYVRASASLNADHPGTLPALAHAMGSRPAGCAVADATCVCTWRFLTKVGIKEIEAAAALVDARTSEAETVQMVARGNRPVDLPPSEAERGYRAGEYSVPADDRVPVSTAAGEIHAVLPEDLTKLLNMGGHVVSPRALKGAELEREYRSWTGLQRIDACVSQPGAVRLVKLDGQTTPW